MIFFSFFSKNCLFVGISFVLVSFFSVQAMKDKHGQRYFLGADEHFLNPGRGQTICIRNDGIELALSFPVQKQDIQRLDAGLSAHDNHMGVIEDSEIVFFLSVASKETRKQICGLIGTPSGANFSIRYMGNVAKNKQALKLLMNFVEEKMSIFTKFKRLEISLSNTHPCFFDMSKLGYKRKGSISDFNGGYTVLFTKDIVKDIVKNSLKNLESNEENVDYIFSRKWLLIAGAKNPDALVQKTKKVFFRKMLLFPCEKSKGKSLKAGIFIYDNNGKYGRRGENLGGCFVKIFNKAKVSHMYIEYLWIHPNVRGGGIAQKILENMELWAEKKFGCQYSYVDTSDHQAPWLYEKCGYKKEILFSEEIETDKGEFYNSYTFVKKFK